MLQIKNIIGLPSLQYHLDNGLTLHENVYRYSSESFIQLFAEARELWRVPLDLPMLNEAEYRGKKVALNKPKRGGSKKFVVYTKNKKGNVVKVSFGGTTGLNVKIDEPGARASFAARHKCAQKKDKTKPGYWACNIGRYWKSLGGKRNFSGYW